MAGKYRCRKGCIKIKRKDDIRFWLRVNKHGPVPKHCPELGRCWVWLGVTRNGYGRCRLICGGKLLSAHRVSWELVKGIIPEGLKVLHKCDNPACVRPFHLFLGTYKDNRLDCLRKGRGSKLTLDQVRKIRKLYASGITQVIIAKKFGVTRETVSAIANRRIWKKR